MKNDEFRVRPGAKVKLSDYPTGSSAKGASKDEMKKRLRKGVKRMREMQELLYAQDRYALLLIFQAMDAAGKDGAIEHVMSGVNPQGCQVFSFRAPSSEELDHDYLWRCWRSLPERGRIGVFNRSYYEEVLIVRVHPHILAGQKLPPEAVTPGIWKERFADINALESYLWRNGTVIRKFFLHVSKEEQAKRFRARLENPEKHWKFSLSDVKEREHWDDYQKAYEEMLSETSTAHAPWWVIPADDKWFTRLTVAEIIVETMEGLKLHYPKVTAEKKKELAAALKLLG
jgi:PPK2 family polyphosphate:nucleotide phosphotransferase